MIKLKLQEQEYNIPDDFSISQWQELMKWEFDEPLNWPRIMHIATGAPLELLKNADGKSIQLGVSFIVNQINQRKPAETIDFESLNFGQWVDLDVWASLGIEKYLKECINILAPGSEPETRLMASEALYIIERFGKWKASVYRNYKQLFGLDEPEDVDVEDENGDKMATARNWYSIIVDLANDDILAIDQVTEQPYKKVFNFMARRKQKAMERQAQELQNKRKHDLQRNRRPL